MKLFYSATSPYVRKVLACAITREIDQQIELLPTNPHVVPPDLLAANPAVQGSVHDHGGRHGAVRQPGDL